MTADRAMIERTLTAFHQPGSVVEIRILETGRTQTVSGYFDTSQPFVQAADQWSGKAPAVYFTLNPCTPALLARSANRLKTNAKQTTSDTDIVHRCWLPLDFDPVRPAGISSTEAEHATALARADACTAWLHSRGWPAPIGADSGNGGHLAYAIDLPNDPASSTLVQHCLEALALHFSDDQVILDLKVFNAARIWKLYGTMACKGDSLPDRPHRLARLLDVPQQRDIVTVAQLEALAALVPPAPKSAPRASAHTPASFDLAGWISAHSLPIAAEGPWQQSGYKWVLKPCPWNADHTDKGAFIVQMPSGAIAAGCHHNGCSGNDWYALRRLYEPDWVPYKAAQESASQPHTPPPRHPRPPAGAQPPDTTRTPPPPTRLQTISASALYAKVLPALDWIIEGILPVGATLFAGRGKDGKSLLAWNLCIAVAEGGIALGHYGAQAGAVLYMALEDGERRAQKRLMEQMHHGAMPTPPARLDLVLWEAPRIGEGLEASLALWLDEHVQARLVVIDILEKVRPRRTRNGSVYADDYAALAPLQRLAQERSIAILIVHHSNKTKPEDFRDTASGSMGLIGACDTFWSLQRIAGAPDAALHVIGRDVEAQELALQFKDGFWTVLGNAEDYRRSQESTEVLEALQSAAKPLTPKQLAVMLQKSETIIRKRLTRMLTRGEVGNNGSGCYFPSPPHTHTTPVGGGEGVTQSGTEVVTDVTCVTDVTDVTDVTLPGIAPESDRGVTLSDTPGVEGVTQLSIGKDSQLAPQSDRVTWVTAGEPLAGTQGVEKTTPVSSVPPCANCGGTDRWIDQHGFARCVACYPPGAHATGE